MQMQTACRYWKYRSVSLLPVLGLLNCPNGSARNPSSKVPPGGSELQIFVLKCCMRGQQQLPFQEDGLTMI